MGHGTWLLWSYLQLGWKAMSVVLALWQSSTTFFPLEPPKTSGNINCKPIWLLGFTLWLFNIAMQNLKWPIYMLSNLRGFSTRCCWWKSPDAQCCWNTTSIPPGTSPNIPSGLGARRCWSPEPNAGCASGPGDETKSRQASLAGNRILLVLKCLKLKIFEVFQL